MESQNHLQMFYDAFCHVGSGYVWLVHIMNHASGS